MKISYNTFQKIQDLLQEAEDNIIKSINNKMYWEAKISAYKAIIALIEMENA